MMQKICFQEDKIVQRRNIFISKVIILILVGLVLSGSILVDAATAGNREPLKVELTLPSSVNLGQQFDIVVKVTNNDTLPVNINKVAVGYGLEIMRFRGPYEIGVTPGNVASKGSITFNVPFRLTAGAGTVVGLVVILAQDDYSGPHIVNNTMWRGVVGSAAGGVKVN